MCRTYFFINIITDLDQVEFPFEEARTGEIINNEKGWVIQWNKEYNKDKLNKFKQASDEKIRSAVMGELMKAFRPEFLGRIDEVIVFSQLSSEEIEEIAGRMIDSLRQRLEAMGITMTFDGEIKKLVAKAGFDPVYGARPLRRALQKEVEDKLSTKILEGSVRSGGKYRCIAEDNSASFEEIMN